MEQEHFKRVAEYVAMQCMGCSDSPMILAFKAYKVMKKAVDNNENPYKAFLKDRLSFDLFIYDLFGHISHMNAHYGKMKDLIVDGLSTSKVSLTVRYKFNTTRSKYKGTGAGESQKNRM